MDVDFSVELGTDCDALEFPWASPDGRQRYYDLRHQPDLLLYLPEAKDYPEIGTFLAALNGPSSIFLTAKCDVWTESELNETEEIYGAKLKYASYVDLLFADPEVADDAPRFSFDRHEQLAERVVELLGRAPEISANAEFIIRRCYFHSDDDPVKPGFFYTLYVFGYGDDPPEGRKRWGIALSLVQNALIQLSAEVRRERV